MKKGENEMNLINRTEVVSAEKDLKAIRKALEDIARGISATEEAYVRDGWNLQ